MSIHVLPQDTKNSQTLQAALEYLRRGWSVIPLHSIRNGLCTCGKADCNSPGKHPPISWKEFQKRHATEAEVRQWFKRLPWANIGIVTGIISGLLVLDIDGKSGMDSIENRELPPTIAVETGGGGRHYYFKYPIGGNIGNKIALLDHVDIRGDAGYVVAPPSTHRSGKCYQWLPGAEQWL